MLKRGLSGVLVVGLWWLTACRGAPASAPAPVHVASTSAPGAIQIKAEVWADNWFAFYLGEQLILEDSVSINTERSFNAEVFTFDATYPMSLNFIAKDYKENDTGLEYIGTDRQQMGDGGFIAQFTKVATGKLLAVTNSAWACTVIHEAPLDKACEKTTNPVAGQAPCGFTTHEEPAGWKGLDFDRSQWLAANEYAEAQVSPKDGYTQITWASSAKLIWGPDLETNNTVLCHLTVNGPTP